MVSNLKDALLNIGLKASKKENDRERIVGRKLNNTEKFQQDRNFCEVCECHQRDVERYKHRNRLLDAEWMCVVCADKEMIDDSFRITNQSEVSKSGAFRRNYGATKHFEKKTTKSSHSKSSKTNQYNKKKY